MSWLPRQIPPKSFGDAWIGEPFGATNHYVLRLDPLGSAAAPYIAGTGAAAYAYLEIPYPHRIIKIEFKHATASDVDDTTVHAFAFARYKWRASPFLIYAETASVAIDDMRICGDGYEYPPGRYRLMTNFTNLYHLFPEITIQILGSPHAASQMKGKEFIQ